MDGTNGACLLHSDQSEKTGPDSVGMTVPGFFLFPFFISQHDDSSTI